MKPDPSPQQSAVAAAQLVITAIEPWYERQRKKNGTMDGSVMCAGLYAAEFLAVTFPLARADFATDSQVKGASGLRAKTLLADHGEHRKFFSEGGRTSRFMLAHVSALADIINNSGGKAGLAGHGSHRLQVASIVQGWFVRKIQDEFFGRKRIEAEINPDRPVWATVEGIINAGRERGGNVAGAVAQHLVGSVLQMRFPAVKINLESYTTADQQTGRAGDYEIGDAAIHVTVSPTNVLFQRCHLNLQHGRRPKVLVPSDILGRAKLLAELEHVDRMVSVQAIDDFVGTAVEEIAGYSKAAIRVELRTLLETYNHRIEAAETDMSLKIEIPASV